jgi:hypothetical protein
MSTNIQNLNLINNINNDLNQYKYQNRNLVIYKDHLTTNNAVGIETEKLLNRERTLFMINSVITLGLIITTFRIIS